MRQTTPVELALAPLLPSRLPARSPAPPSALQARFTSLIEDSVRDLFDPDRIEAIAEDMRVLHRRRKHKVGLLVAALILSAFEHPADTHGRWLDAQAAYRALGGPDSSDSSFQDQCRAMLPVLQELLRRRIDQLEKRTDDPRLRGRLASFTDVLMPDGCAFKVARALSWRYPGTGTVAEFKLHAVYSLRAQGPISLQTTPGRVHDSKCFWPKKWQKGALYLWDLGYHSHRRFISAARAGAHVVQRLKDSDNPLVLASFSTQGVERVVQSERGSPVRLNEALSTGLVHRSRILDLDVLVRYKRRSVRARLVCVPAEGQDRWYLTTLPRSVFSPYDVAELYRLRWEVELLFRQWRGACNLDEVGRLTNHKSIEVAITASLLASLLGQQIARGLQQLEAASKAPPPAPASTHSLASAPNPGAFSPLGGAPCQGPTAGEGAHSIRRYAAVGA